MKIFLEKLFGAFQDLQPLYVNQADMYELVKLRYNGQKKKFRLKVARRGQNLPPPV